MSDPDPIIDIRNLSHRYKTHQALGDVTFTVNRQEAGARLKLDSRTNRVLEIHARSESMLPYDKLEIVRNGEVIASATPSGPRRTAEIKLEHPLRGSGWIAARAMEDLGRYPGVDFSKIHRSEGTLFSSLYGTRRPENVFAHTSPVYATVERQTDSELGRCAVLRRLYAARR